MTDEEIVQYIQDNAIELKFDEDCFVYRHPRLTDYKKDSDKQIEVSNFMRRNKSDILAINKAQPDIFAWQE